MGLTICRSFNFCAAHSLPEMKHSKCKNLHGHNYVLEVEVTRVLWKTFTKTGMIVDFTEFKNIINEHVIDKYDHRNLNDFMQNPTVEVLLSEIADILDRELDTKNLLMKRLRLYETPQCYAEIIK